MNPREAFRQTPAARNGAIIDQETVVERSLRIAILADGHVLMQGLPGVGSRARPWVAKHNSNKGEES
jgi:hypothetical protein